MSGTGTGDALAAATVASKRERRLYRENGNTYQSW
jgi:hypothetical protein